MQFNIVGTSITVGTTTVAQVTGTTTSPSIPVSDPGSRWQNPAWHAYILGLAATAGGSGGTGTFGAAFQVQIQLSPDAPQTPDAQSRWTSPSSLKFTQAGDVFFNAKFRKARIILTGGDGTDLVTVEIV